MILDNLELSAPVSNLKAVKIKRFYRKQQPNNENKEANNAST